MAEDTGTFTALGTSKVLQNLGKFDVSISGVFIATIEMQRSFDKGATWLVTDVFKGPFQMIGSIGGHGPLVRLECTSFTSGTVKYFFGK